MIEVYLVSQQSCKACKIKNDLDTYYKMIQCNCIDIVERKIGGKVFDIVLDDEGLLKENPIPSMIEKNGRIMLVGNLLICHHDNNGNLTSLDKEDKDLIEKNIIPIIYKGKYLRVVKGDYNYEI